MIKTENYITTLFKMSKELGEINGALLVNLHKHNHIPSEDMDDKCDELIELIEQFKEYYRKECEETYFDMER